MWANVFLPNTEKQEHKWRSILGATVQIHIPIQNNFCALRLDCIQPLPGWRLSACRSKLKRVMPGSELALDVNTNCSTTERLVLKTVVLWNSSSSVASVRAAQLIEIESRYHKRAIVVLLRCLLIVFSRSKGAWLFVTKPSNNHISTYIYTTQYTTLEFAVLLHIVHLYFLCSLTIILGFFFFFF